MCVWPTTCCGRDVSTNRVAPLVPRRERRSPSSWHRFCYPGGDPPAETAIDRAQPTNDKHHGRHGAFFRDRGQARDGLRDPPRARVAARVAYAKPVVGLGAGKSLRVARRAASSSASPPRPRMPRRSRRARRTRRRVPASASSRHPRRRADHGYLEDPPSAHQARDLGASHLGRHVRRRRLRPLHLDPENVGKSMLCMFMSGPLLTGTIARATTCANLGAGRSRNFAIPIALVLSGARATPLPPPPKSAIFHPTLTSPRPVSSRRITTQATPRPSTIGTTARSAIREPSRPIPRRNLRV